MCIKQNITPLIIKAIPIWARKKKKKKIYICLMGSPVVTTQCFDCRGPGSVIGGDTKILQNHTVWQKMK